MRIQRRRGGYTLIETLIAVTILVVLSTITFGFNRETRQQLALSIDQARLVGVLTRAKSFALGRYVGAVTGGGTASVNSCAFGVHFATPNRIILFQDLPEGNSCGQCVCNGIDSFNKLFDTNPQFNRENEKIEEIRLSEGIHVALPVRDIVFESPYLQTYWDGVELTQPTVTVTIRSIGSPSRTASVRVGSGAYISSF